MALEDLTGTKYLDDLVSSNPVGATDPKSEGDDHIRGIKNTLKLSFPNVDAACTPTPAEFNLLGGVGGALVSTTDAQTLTNKTLTTPVINSPTLALTQGTTPTPTAEGVIEWDTDDNTLMVGDGAATQTFSPDSKAGRAVQVVNVQDGALATGSTVMPIDDTIPQITEGVEFMTLAITPTSATNILKIEVVAHVSHSTAVTVIASALFQDATAGALAATLSGGENGAATAKTSVFTHYMTSGTVSSTTFRVRSGVPGAGTMTFNGSSAARLMGGVLASSITITEIQA